jgi:hypothetical protein
MKKGGTSNVERRTFNVEGNLERPSCKSGKAEMKGSGISLFLALRAVAHEVMVKP